MKTSSPTPDPTLTVPEPPGWIAFASYGGSTLYGLDIIHTSGKGWRRIVNLEFPELPAWSPDGQWIAVNSGMEIYLVRPDGSEIVQLTHSSEIASQWRPSWSPDSQMILYSQTMNYSDHFSVDLFTINVNTRLIHQLTNTPGISETGPVWSPRGDKIAYIAAGEPDYPEAHLMVMDTDGNYQHNILAKPMAVDNFTWAQDGNAIIFSAGDPCKDLYTINLDGSGLQNLTNRPGDSYYPALSPTGEWIAFAYSSCINGVRGVVGTEVFLMKANGQSLRLLTKKPSQYALSPSWSPIPGLQIGKTFAITDLGADLKLRASASLTGAVQLKIPKGEELLVLDGPVEADQFLWWRVRLVSSGQEGWVAENPGWFLPEEFNQTQTFPPAPTTTDTAVPTLSAETLKAILQDLFSSSGGCELPCWWGIQPGDPLGKALSLSPILGKNPYVLYNQYSYTVSLDNVNFPDLEVVFYEKNNLIQRTQITMNEPSRVEEYRELFSKYGILSEFMSSHGQPSDVLLQIQPRVEENAPIGYFLTLIYEKQGFGIQYSGTVDAEKPVRVCLTQPYNIHLDRITLYLQDPGAMQSLRSNLSGKGFKPIEEVTSLSLDEFFQSYSMTGNQKCIETDYDG